MQKLIVPDVSRHVHFIPDNEDRIAMSVAEGQPLHAVVIFVIDARTVNLAITDHYGMFHTRLGVTLVQPFDELPGGSYCRWMPYQVQQALRAQAPEVQPEVQSSGALGAALTDLIANTATSLKPEDLASVKA